MRAGGRLQGDGGIEAPNNGSDDRPVYRSHYIPRTREGWIGAVAFLGLFALTQPPIVFLVANRIAPSFLGMPFLYSYLLVIYFAMVGVLIWIMRRDI